MGIVADSSPADEEKKSPSALTDFSSMIKSKAPEEAAPWIDHAVQQALVYQKTIVDEFDGATKALRSRFSEISSTSSAHLHQSIDSLQDAKSELAVYEDMLFGKMKEGVKVAASYPWITGGVVICSGCVLLKRPRRILYYNTLRLLMSEEALHSRADAKVKELRQSMNLLKAESEKLGRRASLAEEQLIRGRTKLRQAGKQIQGVITSAYKIERQAAGLKDILQELPSREASRFRSQVTNLASEAKKERNTLTKEVTKISNYGISV
ncbi:uncharacterized protein [Euphorbia lathyris]|uniref:uncharacterized protein n=1 Tax=Euphorbia lathyris TaxID=212925 RepID=UPI0033136B82